jgi:DinB superfamily
MKRFFVILSLLGCGMAGVSWAQMGGPMGAPSMANDIKQAYNTIKNNLTLAAEKMPEDGYGYQPTKEERNFGGWVAHVADSQMTTCSRIAGTNMTPNAASKTTKADLVAALRASFDACDPVYAALTDANAAEGVAAGRAQRPRLTVLAGNIAHDNECYGSMAVYLRLKGIVPPSTEAMGQMPNMPGMGGRGQMPPAGPAPNR